VFLLLHLLLSLPSKKIFHWQQNLELFPMSRTMIAIGTILLAGLISAINNGCGGKSAAEEKDEAKSDRPVVVETASAQLQTLKPTVELVGSIMPIPEKMVVLSCQVSGLVESVNVVEGQEIHAGESIVHLDDRMTRAALAKAVAAREEAAANLVLLKKGPLPAEIEAARQDVKKAEHLAQSLRVKYEALKPLRDAGEVSSIKHEEACSNMEAAQAEWKVAAAKLAVMEAGTRPENIAQAEAKLAAAKAEVATQELALDLTTVKSPIEGIVTQLPARQGMYIQPGATIATIMDLSSVFARFKIPSACLSRLNEGAHVDVQILSLGEMKCDGVLTRIRKEADAQTGDVEAFASIANPQKALRPNLACRLSVALPEIPNALVIPSAAVSDKSGTPVVTIVIDGKASEKEVRLGVKTPTQTQILEGLSEGDIVTTKGGYGLPDGCPVISSQENKQN
jgi:multidrug efflux pump subunit AcrA (membrane-fusion protein)